MAHDVFISYSSKNKSTANAICHALEQNGIKCWIAPRDIIGGQQYGDIIVDAIKTCKVFVIVFSEESKNSQWVGSELNIAFTENKIIIPFKIDTSYLEGEMRLILSNKHWIEGHPDPEREFGTLILSLKNFLYISGVAINNTEKNESFLLLIEGSYLLDDAHIVVFGYVEKGVVSAGNKLQIIGPENESNLVTCLNVLKSNEIIEIGKVGDDIDIILSNVGNIIIKKDMVIAQPGSMTPHSVKIKEWKLKKPFLMAIADTFYAKGYGVVVTGRIENGIVHPGDRLQLIGLSDNTKMIVCKSVERSGVIRDEGKAGEDVGLLLSETNSEDIKRGQVLATPSTINAHTTFIAEVYILKKEEGGLKTPIQNKFQSEFFIRTIEVSGVIYLMEKHESILPGTDTTIQVKLITPMAINVGLRFAVRKSNTTIGAGKIIRIIE